MFSVSSIVIGIFCVLAIYLGVRMTGHFAVGLLFAVVAVMIGKSVQPAVLTVWDRLRVKLFKLPECLPFYEKDLVPTEDYEVHPLLLGMRVLVMTEDTPYCGETKKYYDRIAEEALEALSDEKPLFELRLRAVRHRNAPVQYAWSLCGADGVHMKKCLQAWFYTGALCMMKSREKDKDLFLHDGNLRKEDGSFIPYTVMVLFDQTLPVTIPDPQTQKS